MDGLNDEERALAWKSAWQISLTGMALLTENFQFYRVNPQWVKVLEVPATEFYGKTFSDITPPDIRKADEMQAKLVVDGKINSYLMHKKYAFSNGKEKAVTLLVTRVPMDCEKPFLYFLSRIMLRTETDAKTISASSLNQTLIDVLTDFVMKYAKVMMMIGTVIGGIILALWGT